jgi:hypothetical protein
VKQLPVAEKRVEIVDIYRDEIRCVVPIGQARPLTSKPMLTDCLLLTRLAPVSWTHYQLLQYPGVAMLLVAALRRRCWWLALATAACFALVYQMPQLFLISYRDSHNGWTTASPVTLYFWTSVPPFASLAIFAFALVMTRRTGARRQPDYLSPAL